MEYELKHQQGGGFPCALKVLGQNTTVVIVRLKKMVRLKYVNRVNKDSRLTTVTLPITIERRVMGNQKEITGIHIVGAGFPQKVGENLNRSGVLTVNTPTIPAPGEFSFMKVVVDVNLHNEESTLTVRTFAINHPGLEWCGFSPPLIFSTDPAITEDCAAVMRWTPVPDFKMLTEEKVYRDWLNNVELSAMKVARAYASLKMGKPVEEPADAPRETRKEKPSYRGERHKTRQRRPKQLTQSPFAEAL